MNTSVFKAYDIRGVYPDQLNEESFEAITAAIAHFFKNKLGKDHPTLLLSRDMRISSPSLYEVAKKTLVACGVEVIDADLLPTPTFYYGVLKYQYDGGIHVTASHNPKEYAGTKFVLRDGNTVLKIGKSTGMLDIQDLAVNKSYDPYTNDGKVTESPNILADEVADALKDFDISTFKPFTVVADPANGMGGLYLKEVFKHIPGTLEFINEELDGTFPAHQADPLDFDNLKPLQDLVREKKADVGVEPDGDGDRIFFVDERAEIVPATMITALIASEALAKNPSAKIIADIRYTRNVSHIVEAAGSKMLTSKVGHAFITQDVNTNHAYFAGESSGHFYFGETGGAESAVKVLLYVLHAMSTKGQPLSQILASLHTSYESGERNFVLPESVKAADLLTQIQQEHTDATISSLDGLAVDYPDWRFNIRTSNTEPLLRLNVEADTEADMKTHFDELTRRIEETGATQKGSH